MKLITYILTLGFIVFGVFLYPVEFQTSQAFMQPYGWIAATLGIGSGIALAVFAATKSRTAAKFIMVSPIFFGWIGYGIGVKSVPLVIHQLSEREVISAEITIIDTTSSYKRRSRCRQKVWFEPAIRDYGETLCKSSLPFLVEGERVNIQTETSWAGSRLLQYKKQDILETPYLTWAWYTLLIAGFHYMVYQNRKT